MGGELGFKVTLEFFEALHSDVWGVTNYSIEARIVAREDLRESNLPVEGVDPLILLVIQHCRLFAMVEISTDERVAALDVVVEIGKRPLLEHPELRGERRFGLAFEHFEEQRELGDLDGLRVYVHAVDVVEEDALLLVYGEVPLAAVALVELSGPLPGAVLDVAVAVPVEEVLVGPDQERPGPTRRIHYPESARPAARSGTLAFQELPDGLLDDVVHDVGRRVVDAARLADLRLLL